MSAAAAALPREGPEERPSQSDAADRVDGDEDGGGDDEKDVDQAEGDDDVGKERAREGEGEGEGKGKENEGEENEAGNADRPKPGSASRKNARRAGKRPAPFPSFVPKNAQGSGVKRRQLSPSFLQRRPSKADNDQEASTSSPSRVRDFALARSITASSFGSSRKARSKEPGASSTHGQATDNADAAKLEPETGNRVNHIPVEDVMGPNSNSVDLYADFLGAMSSNHPKSSTGAGKASSSTTSRTGAGAEFGASRGGALGANFGRSSSLLGNFFNDASTSDSFHARKLREQLPLTGGTASASLHAARGERAKVALAEISTRYAVNWALAHSLTVESRDADGLDWADNLWSPLSMVAGIREAARSSSGNASSGGSLLSSLSHFEHPSPHGPSAADLHRLQGSLPASSKMHAQQRVDGSSDGPAGEGSERTRGGGGLQSMSSMSSLQGDGGGGAGAAAQQQHSQHDGGFMGTNARGTARRDEAGSNGLGAGSGIGEGHLVFDKRCTWGAAFKSLVSLLEHGKCPYFYLNDADSGIVGLFMGSGQLGGDSEAPVCAVLSRSSASLRSQLTRCRVPFECPLDTSLEKDVSTIDPDLQDELRAYSRSASASRGVGVATSAQLGRSSSMVGSDEETRSLLGFVGLHAVHGLYNVLVNRVVRRSGLHECPQLLSPVPFLHSTCEAPPRSVPRVVRSAFGKETREVDTLKLASPMAAPRLVGALRAVADAVPKGKTYTVRLQVDSSTRFFNEALRKIASRHGLGAGRAQPLLGAEITLSVGAARVEVASM